MQGEPILRVESVSKSFPGVKALDNVNFDIHAGEVVALVGENGAGKSTLMKILSGAYTKDSGTIYLDGKSVEFTSPSHAQEMGIATIYQEFNLTPTQTVAANIFISREPRRPGLLGKLQFIDRVRMEHEAQTLLDLVGSHVQPDAIIRDLSVAERQMVEIAKALAVDARIIIMDEPTSALGDDEVEVLFRIVRELKAQGRGIIFITHRMEEIFQICDRVVVFRDGQYVGELPMAEATTDQIISMMVGRTLGKLYQKVEAQIGDVIFEVRGLRRTGVVEDVSFDLRAGEILGVAGLVGAGRTEMARLLFGVDAKDAGEILINGVPVNIHSPRAAVEAGIGLVPEDRGGQGLVLKLSVLNNTAMATLPRFTHGGFVNRGELEDGAQEYVEKLSVRTPSLEQKAMNLSGGNQQKVVVAKWLLSNPKILILDEPTRGIDVGTKSEIYALMSQLASQGMGIIMISSEMPEVLAMSDRIMVLCEGRLTAILDRSEATQERIMAFATGHATEGATLS